MFCAVIVCVEVVVVLILSDGGERLKLMEAIILRKLVLGCFLPVIAAVKVESDVVNSQPNE